MKILICGLPGSGKTWLAERLVQNIDNCAWYNADIVRSASNDWDFSKEGRSRQAMRMKTFANFEKSNGRYVICDFVAPTKASRDAFEADYLIWLNTIMEGRVVESKKNELKNSKDLPFEVETLETSQAFKDTTNMFEEPNDANKIITSFMNDQEIAILAKEIINV
jgi:adenylylsulfate kinase|tara:strand:- start:262 stop:756 length:495 start_codon:yes stop_codon:yes gene_type:complete